MMKKAKDDKQEIDDTQAEMAIVPVEMAEPEPVSWEQDEAEVQKMVDWYKANYPEVYVLHCLANDHVIGIEVAGQFADGVVLEKGRTFYNYNDLCLAIRRREDLNENNEPMYGYECACGNRTTLAAVEMGIVPIRGIIKDGKDIIGDTGAVSMGTPYEVAQAAARIAENQAKGEKADYETQGTMERYETFKLERVK